MDAVRRGPKVRAPELPSTGWIGPEPHSLRERRGSFVLLHFWTSSCANCLHVLDELRTLRPDDALTVLGVHSPKFPHEAEPAALAAAVGRHGITHPVVSDPELRTWREYAVRAWPTLVLIDPDGYIVAQASGEGHVRALATIAAEPTDNATRTASADQRPAIGPPDDSGPLRYPGKALLLPAARTGRDTDTVLVADTAHHQLVETTLDGATVLRRIGAGRGDPFTEPTGLTLLPDSPADYDVAAKEDSPADYDVLVADTGAHVLRGLRLADGAVTHTIDLPAQLATTSTVTGRVPGVLSPWDVAWWPAAGQIVVAAAGVHLLLGVDPRTDATTILAGTTVEGLRDGPALEAWLAQPSGLAVDGDRVWFVDAESSSLRYLTLDGDVRTAVGEGLFDFGLVDGPADTARLQHPLGLAVLPDGAVAIADTFNGALRRYDPTGRTLSTLARGLAEPGDVLVTNNGLLVVESAGHRLSRLPVPLSVTPSPGLVHLSVDYDVPVGQDLDGSGGPAAQLDVTADPMDLVITGAGPDAGLHRDLELNGADGILHVRARVLTCDTGPAVEHPACHVTQHDWTLAVHPDPGGQRRIELVLPS